MNSVLIDGFLHNAGERDSEARAVEKIAIMGGLVIGGSLLHVGTNAVMKGIKTLSPGKKILHKLYDAGYGHALQNKRISPAVAKPMNYLIGPESMVEPSVGSLVGRFGRIRGKAKKPNQIERLDRRIGDIVDREVDKHIGSEGYVHPVFLNEFKKNVKDLIKDPAKRLPILRNEVPIEVQRAPILDSMFSSHYSANPKNLSRWDPRRLLTVHGRGKSPVSNAVGSAVLGAGMVASPTHGAVQMGISRLRELVGGTNYGRKFIKRQFLSGLSGESVPRWKEIATDMVLSPAALDPRRIGLAINSGYSRKLGIPITKEMVEKMRGLVSQLRV